MGNDIQSCLHGWINCFLECFALLTLFQMWAVHLSQLKFHLPCGALLDAINPPSTLLQHFVCCIYLTLFTYCLILYLFSFINSIVIYWLLLSKSPCMRCFRGQKDGQVTVLAFKYYFSYSAATYVKARTISYSFSIHLFFSFLLPIKRHGRVGIIAHLFDGWMAG